MNIREMRPEDIDQVLRINEECFTTDAWSRKAFEREFELDYSYPFVLEEDGKIMGYAVVWKVLDDVSIMSFAIDRSLWGKGYGKRLLSFIIEYFKGEAKSITLDVRRSNLRAIRLYKSMGFKIVAERPRYYSDGENAFQMGLELEERDATDKGKTFKASAQ